MLRWKLFISLVILLTAVGLLGSYYWSASASNRYLLGWDKSVADVTIDGGIMSIELNNGQTLAEILHVLDDGELAKMASKKKLEITRADMEPVDISLAGDVELILAQAVATSEYYQASLLLKELATRQGYSAQMLIWQGMVVAEIYDAQHSYITLRPVKEGDNP